MSAFRGLTFKLVAGILALLGLLALLLIIGPADEYLRQRIVREGMIYRLLFCSLLMALATTLLSVSLVAERLSRSLLGRRGGRTTTVSRTYVGAQ